MEIIWFIDTNIAWGNILSTDHLYSVARCISKSKKIYLLPAVAAEIKATFDRNMAINMASALTGGDRSKSGGLARKISVEIHNLKKHYPGLKESAIKEFKKTISDFISAKIVISSKELLPYGRKTDSETLRPYMTDEKSKKIGALSKAYKQHRTEVFAPISGKINTIFKSEKHSRDRDILIDLIMTSYHFPNLQICFLTNDKEFYKKWKKVCDSKEYEQFIKDNNIKYPMIFHYIPDLINEAISNYSMYPYPKSSEDLINLQKVLHNCS